MPEDGVRSVGTLASLDLADVGTMVVPKGIQYHFIAHQLRTLRKCSRITGKHWEHLWDCRLHSRLWHSNGRHRDVGLARHQLQGAMQGSCIDWRHRGCRRGRHSRNTLCHVLSCGLNMAAIQVMTFTVRI